LTTKYWLLFFLIFSIELSAEEVGTQLYNKYKKAVVKITVYEHGVPMTTGSGFFLGKKGYIATNYHVIKPAFSQGYSLLIETHDGKKFFDYKVGTCTDDRSIDLCMLKVNFSPEENFIPKPVSPQKGEKIYVIGHPLGLDYTFSDGLVSNFSPAKKKEDIDAIQISAPISPGNSGGPIFNSHGVLYGMATSINGARLAQNLNFGIAVSEIYKLAKKRTRPITINQYKRNINLKVKKAIAKISKDFYLPAFQNLKKGEDQKSLDGLELPRFKVAKFKVDNGFYFTYVPVFYECSQHTNSPSHKGFVCVDQLTLSTQIDFSFFPYSEESLYKELNDKIDHQSRPVKSVKNLQTSGEWDTYKSQLSPQQIKGLHSYQIKPWRCKKKGKNEVYYIYDNTEVCTATLMNDVEPNAMTQLMLFQDKKSGMIIKVAGHIKDQNYKKLGFFGSKISTQLITFVTLENLERHLANFEDASSPSKRSTPSAKKRNRKTSK
tara:strand:- start:56564 stop:58033 length:1470 start_codon:yes stop_codon:yes gene_type:complete